MFLKNSKLIVHRLLFSFCLIDFEILIDHCSILLLLMNRIERSIHLTDNSVTGIFGKFDNFRFKFVAAADVVDVVVIVDDPEFVNG